MNNKLFFIDILLLTLFCFGCNTKNNHSTDVSEIEIVDFNSFEKVEIDYIPEQLIKEIKYIKLDDKEEDFLFKRIDKIKIHDDKIYILDGKLKKLIVFNQNGGGIGRVGTRGQGPEEYLQIADFDVNDSGDIYFIDATQDKDKLFVFNRDLQFVFSKKLPFEADIIHCLPDNKLLFGLASWNQGNNAPSKILLTDSKLKTEKSYLQYDEYKDDSYWISFYRFAETENSIFYNKQIDNFVYQFSLYGDLIKAYYFDFGKQNVLDKDKKDIEANLNKFEYYRCLKNFVVINDKYILGTLWDKLKTKSFIIDRNDKNLYLSKESADFDLSNMAGYYNNQIISFIYPGKYDDIQATNLPQDVKKYVEDENFVVCLYELK